MRRLGLLIGLICSHAFVAAATVVRPVAGAPAVVIPAAGSTAGANGTYFHTDIQLLNTRFVAQRIALDWLPLGESGPQRSEVTLLGRHEMRDEDFVANVLHKSGLGAIVVTGLREDGTPDPDALLTVSVRIWTVEPGKSGTNSQTFFSVPLSDIHAISTEILGLRRSDQYRVNVGIANLDPERTVSFFVDVPSTIAGLPPETYSIDVPPMSLKLFPLNSNIQLPLDIVTVETGDSTAWLAFGSSVDNTTGDAWSELATER